MTAIQNLSKDASNAMAQGQQAVLHGVEKGVLAREAIDGLIPALLEVTHFLPLQVERVFTL